MAYTHLLHAQNISLQLFDMAENENLIVAGKTEKELNDEIAQLAKNEFGIETHWHKRIIRTGINTLVPYSGHPSDRVIQPDDILFIDYGPIVNGWEADIGRTYVLGNNSRKLRLKNDVERAWYEIRNWFQQQDNVKASDLYNQAVEKASAYGWRFAGDIAGHIVGLFPHEQPADPKSLELDVHPDNHDSMSLTDSSGHKRHWILELQFVDDNEKIGAYFEQLLC